MKNMFCEHINLGMNRRDFFGRFALGIGGAALTELLRNSASASEVKNPFAGVLDHPHFAPKAKRIIYLFMAGGPSQHDLFDYKPLLNQMNGEDLPASVRMGQRLTGMSAHQARLPLAGSIFKFAQHGPSGAWVSELHAARPRKSPMSFASSARCTRTTSIMIRRSPSSRRAINCRAARRWARGSRTDSETPMPICPPSSCSSRRTGSISRSTRGSGEMGFCLVCIKGCSFGPAAIPFCSSTIRPAFPRKAGARCSTASRN